MLTMDHLVAAMKLMPKPLPDMIVCSPGDEEELLKVVDGLDIEVKASEFMDPGQVFTITFLDKRLRPKRGRTLSPFINLTVRA